MFNLKVLYNEVLNHLTCNQFYFHGWSYGNAIANICCYESVILMIYYEIKQQIQALELRLYFSLFLLGSPFSLFVVFIIINNALVKELNHNRG